MGIGKGGALALLLLLGVALAWARPAQGPLEDGKNVGKTGFANIVEDDITGNVDGWVRYGKENGCLKSTWVLEGLRPGVQYQLKIHSIGGDTRLLACGGDTAMCGTMPDGTGTYLVMDIVKAGPSSRLNTAVKECRLPAGAYEGIMFLVTEHGAPFPTGHTWQNAPGVSTFTIR